MKSFLILFLAVALVASAFFTRPSRSDFKKFVKENTPRDRRSLPEKIFGRPAPNALLRDAEFKDRILWVEVHRDGKLVYTGAFNHWFDRTGRATKQS